MDNISLIIQFAIGVVGIVALWKVFAKAGQPGWAALVPFYNLYVMTQVAGKPGWWVLLFFVPFVNIVLCFLLFIAFAQKFGKGAGFGVGLTLLTFIFMPILAFGDAQYDAAA